MTASATGATCRRRTVAPVLRARAPTASTMLSVWTASSSGTRMRFAMAWPSRLVGRQCAAGGEVFLRTSPRLARDLLYPSQSAFELRERCVVREARGAGHVLDAHRRPPRHPDLERAANRAASLGPVLVREHDPDARRLEGERCERARQSCRHSLADRPAGGDCSELDSCIDPGYPHSDRLIYAVSTRHS